MERLLVERISLRGICRAVGVGLTWLLGLLVQGVKALPDHLNVAPLTCKPNVMIQRLDVTADEMSRFVKKKANKQWIWLASSLGQPNGQNIRTCLFIRGYSSSRTPAWACFSLRHSPYSQ